MTSAAMKIVPLRNDLFFCLFFFIGMPTHKEQDEKKPCEKSIVSGSVTGGTFTISGGTISGGSFYFVP